MSTVTLHRILRTSPENVYRAFLDKDAFVRWIPPKGFYGKVLELDAQVGGKYKMSFTNFTTGHEHSFGGEYLELIPNEKIRYNASFDDANLSGEMTTTIELKKVSVGVELTVVQGGIPDMIPVELCYLGWQESLEFLTMLVEPQIDE